MVLLDSGLAFAVSVCCAKGDSVRNWTPMLNDRMGLLAAMIASPTGIIGVAMHCPDLHGLILTHFAMQSWAMHGLCVSPMPFKKMHQSQLVLLQPGSHFHQVHMHDLSSTRWVQDYKGGLKCACVLQARPSGLGAAAAWQTGPPAVCWCG